jgi:hypothetical protein
LNNLKGLAGKQGLFIYFMGDFVGGFHSFIRRTPLLYARNYFYARVRGYFQFMRELSLCSLLFFVCVRTPLLRVILPFACVFFNRLQVGFSNILFTTAHQLPTPCQSQNKNPSERWATTKLYAIQLDKDGGSFPNLAFYSH